MLVQRVRDHLRCLRPGARAARAWLLRRALRATVAVLALLGGRLALSDAERHALLVRVQAALLGARA